MQGNKQGAPLDSAALQGDSRDERVASAVQSFRIVVRAIQAHSQGVVKQCGISQTQLWLLWEIFGQPGMRVSELSRCLSIKPATASNLLDKVEKRGLVRRERVGPDQRVVRLFLTHAGAELLNSAPRPAQGALVDGLSRLDDRELRQLNRGMAALIERLDVQSDSAAHTPLPSPDP